MPYSGVIKYIVPKNILFNNDYKKLFKKVPQDATLQEVICSGSNRIFFYTVESARIFFVIAIKENHMNLH